jgi:drug/metabolite transporter (DMT)-like permease
MLPAYRHGKASLVTALTSLYPAVTVALAVPLLGERLDVTKVLAIALALGAGVTLSKEAGLERCTFLPKLLRREVVSDPEPGGAVRE